MEDVTNRLRELSEELKRIASLASTLEMALTESNGKVHEFTGAAFILTRLLHEHVRKLEAVGRVGKVEG